MPPPAADPDVTDAEAPPSLDDASARLESALARLEALVEAGPLQSDLFRAHGPDEGEGGVAADLAGALEASRSRERALEAAAAAASQALGRAVEEVRHALEAGGAVEPDGDEAADAALDPAAATVEDA